VASDYAIWEPRWQVEASSTGRTGRRGFSDYPRLTTDGREDPRLNAAKLYGIDVPEEFRIPDEAGTPAAREDAQLVDSA